ncbi:uncharacterized mitochondrial protein-like protein [Tanacetum coccineum]
MTKNTNEHGFISVVYEGKTHEDLHTCLFVCFLSQEEPKRIAKALSDLALGSRDMQEECYSLNYKKISSMGELNFFLGLHVKQREDGTFISQDKYVARILRKFGFTDVRTASTPMDTKNPLLKDYNSDDVDVHLYRLMIRSLMYLTSSRPDIMYLKGQPKLGLWYSDSDYVGASLDRKSTTGGCQFLGCRLISWQCKRQTVVATSSTEAEYMADLGAC